MRRLLAVLLLPILGCADGPTSSPALSPDVAGASEHKGVHHARLVAVYNIQLRAENEVPPCTLTEALGHAQLKLYANRLLEWTIFVNNKAEETFFGGHIHVGGPTVAGPIVQSLFFSGSTRHIRTSGSVTIPLPTGTAVDLFLALLNNPGNYYVNLHTPACPGGAVRGQLP
jgi:hypothetical protein